MVTSDSTARAPLPVIDWTEARAYGSFTVRKHDDGRLEAISDVPPRCAFTRELLDQNVGHPSAMTWDGHKITVDLDNGSWTWVAEAQDIYGDVIYARWPD